MDTLIDNRNFPSEMQENKQPISTKKTPWIPLLLIIIGVLVLVFLVYILFIKKPEPFTEPQTIPTEVVKENIIIMQQNTPIISTEERNRKVSAFFN